MIFRHPRRVIFKSHIAQNRTIITTGQFISTNNSPTLGTRWHSTCFCRICTTDITRTIINTRCCRSYSRTATSIFDCHNRLSTPLGIQGRRCIFWNRCIYCCQHRSICTCDLCPTRCSRIIALERITRTCWDF